MPADGTVFEDSSGEIVAYCAADRWPRAMRITEVGAEDPAFYEHVLRYACDIAFQKRVTELEIYVPLDHPFADICKSLGCTVSIDYPYASDGMGRIINLESTFRKLVPVFEERLRKSCSKELPSRISLKTDIGLITLDISDSGVSLSESKSTNWIEFPQSSGGKNRRSIGNIVSSRKSVYLAFRLVLKPFSSSVCFFVKIVKYSRNLLILFNSPYSVRYKLHEFFYQYFTLFSSC